MVGVLALQGDFEKHRIVLDNLNVQHTYVKNAHNLDKITALIIPGGESTTLSMLIDRYNLRESLIEFSKKFSIFGTCAGMIMLSRDNIKSKENMVDVLNIMDFSVSRNSWGSQKYSFEQILNFEQFKINSFNAVFIRAPKVVDIGPKIENISYFNEEAVMIDDGKHLACSFHPELDNDNRVHEYFLNKYYYGKK